MSPSLSLNRFGRRQALAMIDRVAGGKALPAEVLEQIVAKTDGVPLFVEELTKTVLESGLLREENGAYVLASRADPACDPLDPAGFADGAARSPRAGQGDRADRRGDRTRVLLSVCWRRSRRSRGRRCRTRLASSWRQS